MKLKPDKIKKRIMKIGNKTRAGHVMSAMSCVDLLCKVYSDMEKDAIVILSKGHGALAQYVILNELGKLPDEVLDTYLRDGGLSEHCTLAPEYGIYASTGSLGHGLGIGLGYALADRERAVYVILGDGELDEGSTMEALKIRFELEINNLIPIVDLNGLQGFKVGSLYMLGFVHKSDTSKVLQPFKVYYSKKGERTDTEDKLESHYLTVTDKVLKQWTKKQ